MPVALKHNWQRVSSVQLPVAATLAWGHWPPTNVDSRLAACLRGSQSSHWLARALRIAKPCTMSEKSKTSAGTAGPHPFAPSGGQGPRASRCTKSGSLGKRCGKARKRRPSLHLRTAACASRSMTIGGSIVQSSSLPSWVTKAHADFMDHPTRRAVTSTAAAGPVTTCQGEAFALAIRATAAWWEAVKRAGACQRSHQAKAHVRSGKACASKAGSTVPPAPSDA